jgi:hypothetical protein
LETHPNPTLHPDWIRFANAEIMTIRGKVRSSWTKEPGVLRLSLEIPVGAEAEVLIPAPEGRCVVREGSRIIWKDGPFRGRRVPGIVDPFADAKPRLSRRGREATLLYSAP